MRDKCDKCGEHMVEVGCHELLEMYIHENQVLLFVDGHEVDGEEIKGKRFKKVSVKETIHLM